MFMFSCGKHKEYLYFSEDAVHIVLKTFKTNTYYEREIFILDV
jgi:hypothetical protein